MVENDSGINFHGWVGVGGGWLDQVGLKLTQSPTKVGVEVGTELGKKWAKNYVTWRCVWGGGVMGGLENSTAPLYEQLH